MFIARSLNLACSLSVLKNISTVPGTVSDGFFPVMLRIHAVLCLIIHRSRTRSIEWMINRCISDEIHLFLRRRPKQFYR